jgi:hypothetical protein
MEEIFKFIHDKQSFPNLKEVSIKKYNELLTSLNKKSQRFNLPYDLTLFNNEQFMLHFDETLAITTQRTNLVQIKTIIDRYKLSKNIDLMSKELYDKFVDRYNNISNKVQDKQDKQEYTTKYNLDKLHKIMNMYPEDSIEYLFFATSLLVPPRRRDWGDAIFVTQIPDIIENKNYVVIENDEVYLLFNAFKISKVNMYEKLLNNNEYAYLKYDLKLNPDKLATLLKKSYKNNPREYVFMNTRDEWQSYVTDLYNGFSQNTFRHCFAQYLFSNFNLNELYLKKIAWDFGDKSTHTMRLHYTNPNQNDEFEDECIISEFETNIIKHNSILQQEIDIIQQKIDKNNDALEIYKKMME